MKLSRRIFNSPLFKLDNCITTPHLGASTSEAQLNVAIEIAHAVKDALLGAGIRNAANFPSLSLEDYKVIEPYLILAERMGKFAGQLILGRISEVTITYSGSIAKEKITAVTMALSHGLLTPILGEDVNTINSLNIMKERGIKIKEITSTRKASMSMPSLWISQRTKNLFLFWALYPAINSRELLRSIMFM